MLDQIINNGADNLPKVVSSLNIYQIASLLILQNLPEMRDKQTPYIERQFALKVDDLNFRLKRDGLPSVRAELISVLNLKNIQQGYKLLPFFRIALLDEKAIKDQKYLTPEGKWDYSFNERRSKEGERSLVHVDNDRAGKNRRLTLEQSRIYTEIQAQPDDHSHIQGYAGTGKSSLLIDLISMLNSNRKGVQILVLVQYPMQVRALVSRIGELPHVSTKTFASLAFEIIPQDLTNKTNWNMHRRKASQVPIADDELIKHFGIMTSGGFSSDFIVRAIRATLFGFCCSGDTNIQLSHIPKHYISSADETTRQIILHYAAELWSETLIPTSKGFKPPIRGYHRIKWIALNGWQIPNKYTHVLIDECHDLKKSVLQILDCSPQAVISFGDEYQNLQGRSQQRSNIIRHREVTRSVRSGCLIESIVNPIIARHPGKTKAPFLGNNFIDLKIVYYDKLEIPNTPVTILVNDMWELFELAQHMASKNINFGLLSDAENFNMFVHDCIDLHCHGTRPRHGELFRFKDWNKISDHYQNNESFQKIHRMLEKGYQYKDWLKTSAKFTSSHLCSYLLGKIEDARNHDFQRVMIAPEAINVAWKAGGENFGAIASVIYIAVTRAVQCLIVPERLRNWIEEISSGSLLVQNNGGYGWT